MFEQESIRLLREKWRNVQQLAEELFAIFQSRGEVIHDGSLQIRPTDQSTPISILQPFTPSQADDDTPGFTITRGGNTLTLTASDLIINNQSLANGDFGGGGDGTGIDLNQIVGISNAPEFSPFVLIGIIRSGSGSSYMVEVFSTPSNSLGTVTATQLQIDPDETIPAGTFCQVVGLPFRSGDSIFASYFLTVPVWL